MQLMLQDLSFMSPTRTKCTVSGNFEDKPHRSGQYLATVGINHTKCTVSGNCRDKPHRSGQYLVNVWTNLKVHINCWDKMYRICLGQKMCQLLWQCIQKWMKKKNSRWQLIFWQIFMKGIHLFEYYLLDTKIMKLHDNN